MHIAQFAHLVLRQEAAEALEGGDDLAGTPGHCDLGNEFDGKIGARISSIFVILVGSFLGAWFPVYAKRRMEGRLMEMGFFFAKYFGSGVIIATAFIHLLAPSHESLTNECLTGPITEYPWTDGIALMTIFALFWVELVVVRYASFGSLAHTHSHGHGHDHDISPPLSSHGHSNPKSNSISEMHLKKPPPTESNRLSFHGKDHLGHLTQHVDNDAVARDWDEHRVCDAPGDSPPPHHANGAKSQKNDVESCHEHDRHSPESYVAQLTSIFILEFGIIFHSIFIGLALAVSGAEFATLYVVLTFHQTFEGLGLGTRLAAAPWPRHKRRTPYYLALAYGFSTPVAIAIGLAVRDSYPPGSQTTLVVNGVFDAVAAGILIYTGLVELMAHEFMFAPAMRKAGLKTVGSAFGLMCLGAALMALLGKWA